MSHYITLFSGDPFQYKEKEKKENQRKANLNKEKPFFQFPGKYLYITDFIDCATICNDLLYVHCYLKIPLL